MKAKHLIEHFVKCREVIMQTLYNYINKCKNKEFIITTPAKTYNDDLFHPTFIPLKVFIKDNGVYVEFSSIDDTEETYEDYIDVFSADEIFFILNCIESSEQ